MLKDAMLPYLTDLFHRFSIVMDLMLQIFPFSQQWKISACQSSTPLDNADTGERCG